MPVKLAKKVVTKRSLVHPKRNKTVRIAASKLIKKN